MSVLNCETTKQVTKLTLVSVYYNGSSISGYYDLPVVNGKSILPSKILEEILNELGVRRGDTYSICI